MKRRAPEGGAAGGAELRGSGAFQKVRALLQEAVVQEGFDSDYTNVVRPLERASGLELHSGPQTDTYRAPAYAPTPEGGWSLSATAGDERMQQ